MSNLDELLDKIYKSRNYLITLIDRENGLINSEIIEVSKMLDDLLNEYEKLISEKEKGNKDLLR